MPYFKKAIDTMRALDSTRPVTMVHTMWPATDKVSQWLDVICINRYMDWYSDHGHLEVVGLQLKNELNEWHEKYHKPALIMEYGVPGGYGPPSPEDLPPGPADPGCPAAGGSSAEAPNKRKRPADRAASICWAKYPDFKYKTWVD